MTDMEPERPGPLLKHMRAQNDALRWEIVREITNMNHGDLQAVLRMIETWKGRAVQPAHVNKTPKSEHDAANVLTTAAKGGGA